MTLKISQANGAVRLRKTWQPMDPDAAAYITAVEAADTAAGSPGGLEERTKIAIDNFILGCKADGIWPAIKASCILAGARTLQGALVPLVGTAPTNYNFVAGDYNRKTGLVGNGSTKYLDSNRAANADPQNNAHLGVYITQAVVHGNAVNNYSYYLGSSDNKSLISSSVQNGIRASINGSWINSGMLGITNFFGASRSLSTAIQVRSYGALNSVLSNSISPNANSIRVFRGINFDHWSNARLAFYSIGESLNLALLDARVTDLINAFASAIP